MKKDDLKKLISPDLKCAVCEQIMHNSDSERLHILKHSVEEIRAENKRLAKEIASPKPIKSLEELLKKTLD